MPGIEPGDTGGEGKGMILLAALGLILGLLAAEASLSSCHRCLCRCLLDFWPVQQLCP